MNTTAIPPVAYAPVPIDRPRYQHHEQFLGRQTPAPPVKTEHHACPHCNRGPLSTFGKLRNGMVQLAVALVVIVMSIFRLARLIIAGSFTLVGLIGCGFYFAGQRVVHPDDSKLLPVLPVESNR